MATKPQTFLFGEQSQTNPRAVKRQERRVASRVGGRRQPASGSLPWAKGDVAASDLMVSCKRTKHASISITADMLAEIEQIAMAKNCAPAMAIEMEGSGSTFGGSRRQLAERDWVLVPMRVFEEMLGAVRERDE